MNLSRFQSVGYDEFLRDFYKEKYKDKKIDVVIAALSPSLNFALAHMREIAPAAPIVFCGVDPRDIDGKDLGENVTGVLVRRDFTGTLESALRMQPDTRDVVFIAGTSAFDQQLAQAAKEQLRPLENRVSISYLTDLSLDSVLKRVSQLPPHTIVLFSTFFRDAAGETFVTHEVATRVSDAASVPVYGFVDQYLGRGIVGGHLYSVEAHGTKAAEEALQILHGESVKNIPIVEGNTSVYMFDARQLERWNIDERNLPLGSVVQFREPTVWEEYRWYIVGIIFILAVQSALIGLLLYLRYRRREAEAENTRLHGRLKDIVSNVPGIVWESRTDPAINKRRTTFISDYVERMLGYTADEWLKQPPGFGIQIVPEEERERVLRESDEVIESRKEAVSEFRWVTKDGRIRWVENHLSPIVDGNSSVVGLRGVALDVTERKAAEDRARDTEERNTAIVTAIPDMFFLSSIDGVCLDYQVKNPEDLLLDPEEFLGKNLRDFLPPELAAEHLASFERAAGGAGLQVLEYRFANEKGEKWYESRIVPIGDKVLNVIRDITDLKRSQMEAQEISGRLITAHEDERARLARELHDDACQNLALLSIDLEVLRQNTPTDNGSAEKIRALSERAGELSNDLRRLSYQLHPARLEHLGLAASIRGFCKEMETAHSLEIEFVEANVPVTLPEPISLNVYRIVQESIQNIVKHSGASEASVTLSGNGNELQLTISDNGRGFDPKSPVPEASLGLTSLRERIRLLHGKMSINSRPDKGTRIEATIPV